MKVSAGCRTARLCRVVGAGLLMELGSSLAQQLPSRSSPAPARADLRVVEAEGTRVLRFLMPDAPQPEVRIGDGLTTAQPVHIGQMSEAGVAGSLPRAASVATWTRERMPSLARMWVTWRSTVLDETQSCVAISTFV